MVERIAVQCYLNPSMSKGYERICHALDVATAVSDIHQLHHTGGHTCCKYFMHEIADSRTAQHCAECVNMQERCFQQAICGLRTASCRDTLLAAADLRSQITMRLCM
jgi:hypothetical protein